MTAPAFIEKATKAQIMNAIKTQLIAAIGPKSSAEYKIPSQNFYLKKFPIYRGMSYPCVILSPTRDTATAATNASYDYGHGVLVTIAEKQNQQEIIDDDRLAYWREQAIDKVADKKLTGVASVFVVSVEPGPMYDAGAFASGYDATSFIARAFVRNTNKGV